MKIKLLFLPLVLFSSFIHTNKKETNITLINDNSYIGYIDDISGYKISKANEYYKIEKNDKNIFISGSVINYIEYHNNIYIFRFINNTLSLLIYNDNLERIDNVKIYEGVLKSDLFLSKIDDLIFLSFTNSYGNIEVYSYGEAEVRSTYGGNLEEKILGFDSSSDHIFMILNKYENSGGTFGYGGNDKSKVIAKIDKELNVIKYITLDIKDDIDDFCYRNGYLYVYYNNHVCVFDEDLDLLVSKDLEYNFVYTGCNGIVLTLLNNEDVNYVKTYNSLTFNELSISEIEYDYIKRFNSFIYIVNKDNGYYLDAISFQETKNIENNIVTSLFGKCEYKEIKYDIDYNKMVYGYYPYTVEYLTPYKASIFYKGDRRVNLYTNVYDNGIYPSGYRLDFNGNASLDGKSIAMNYPVYGEGSHTLTIVGSNDEITNITFNISSDQIIFKDDSLIKSDIEANINEKITLSYNIKGINDNNDIIDIIGENISIDDYFITNNKLNIVLNGYSEIGEYNIYIEKEIYKEKFNEKTLECEYYLNDNYLIHICNDIPEIKLLNITDDYSFVFECDDYNNQLRVIEVECISNDNIYTYYFPFCKGKIILNNLKENNYYCNIKALTYTNSNEYSSIDLFTIQFECESGNYNLGDITINNKNEVVNKFTISLNKDNAKSDFKKILVNDEEIIVYNNTKSSKLTSIIIGIISAMLSFGLALLINYLYHLKFKKRNA